MRPILIRTPPARMVPVLVTAALMCGCGDTELQGQGGSLELNSRLRADMGPSAGMQDGRFFADGRCAGFPAGHECGFITPVLGSLMSDGSASFVSRLRRSDFLWVAAGNGYPKLSYEFVGRNMSIVNRDDPSEVFAGNVTVGTCHVFPMLEPESRQPVSGLEDVELVEAEAFVRQFDVTLRSCTAAVASGLSESLQRVTAGCSDSSMRDRVGANPPPAPQNSPFCLVGRGVGSMMGDVSFALVPGAAPGLSLDDLWPGVDVSPRELLPNLKTVLINGTRTISRQMERTGQSPPQPDGSTIYFAEWNVGVTGEQWTENYSPNIVVTRARVRKGPWIAGSGSYLPLYSLDIGTDHCQVRVPGSNDTEYDVPMCRLDRAGSYRVTPAYKFDTISVGRVDDIDRITWEVEIKVPPAMLADSDELFLELDLTAIDPSTSTAGLMADPGARNLGSLRTGLTAAPLDGFLVQNIGVVTAWVESIAFDGHDAAEFGAPIIYRAVSPAQGASGAPITTPLILLAGSAVSVEIQPHFRTMGQKRTEVLVNYRDVQNTLRTIRTPLTALAVSPSINIHPSYVIFNATPGSGPLGSAHARRAALITNDGPITFQRTAVSISGPQASSFRVVGGSYGLAPLDLSQPQAIGPGEAEIYRIGFYPESAGDSIATFTVSTTEGDLSTNLVGYCSEGCQQPPGLAADEPPGLPPLSSTKIAYPKIRLKTPAPKNSKVADDDKGP